MLLFMAGDVQESVMVNNVQFNKEPWLYIESVAGGLGAVVICRYPPTLVYANAH